MLKLTPENYYSIETDWDYMSFSQFKNFEECEAKELARLKGEWEPTKKKSTSTADPLILGNYVHSYFESKDAHEAFIEENKKELLSSRGATKGKLKASYKLAEEIITSLNADDMFAYFYKPGDKEVIVTGEIEGIAWKGKLDSLSLKNGFFCDLKTVDDPHKRHWNADERRWVPFVEDRQYHMQMAVYRELSKQTFGKDLAPLMFAASKQSIPDKMAIDFESEEDQQLMREAMDKILANQDRYRKVMMGEVEPKACGRCEYCRINKQLSDFTHASDIEVD